MAEYNMDLQITRQRREALNKAGTDIYRSKVFDEEKALNTAKSVFDREAVFNTEEGTRADHE